MSRPRREPGIVAGVAALLLVAGFLAAPFAAAADPAAPAAPAPLVGPASSSTSWVSPTQGEALSGVALLSVQSSAATVSFTLDGEDLGTVDVSSGGAELSQLTTGFPNGSHTLVAEGCDTDILGLVSCTSATLPVVIDNVAAAAAVTPSVPLDSGTVYSDVDTFAVGGSGYGLVKVTPVVAAGSGSPGTLMTLPTALPLTGLTGRLTVTACATDASGGACTGGTTQRVITVLSTAPVLTSPATAVVGPHHPIAFTFTTAVAEPVALVVRRNGVVYQRALGTFAAGKNRVVWDGRIAGGLPDGPASAQLVRQGGGGVSTSRRVTVEVHNPTVVSVRAARAFTPGAAGVFLAHATVSRIAQARLVVSRGGHVVATTGWTTASATPVATWSGVLHGRAGRGTYSYVVQVRDQAGNLAVSRAARLVLH